MLVVAGRGRVCLFFVPVSSFVFHRREFCPNDHLDFKIVLHNSSYTHQIEGVMYMFSYRSEIAQEVSSILKPLYLFEMEAPEVFSVVWAFCQQQNTS